MFETYEKPLQLEAMEGQKGIVKIQYQKFLKIIIVKTYFGGKRISRETFTIKSQKELNLLLAARDEKVVLFKEYRTPLGLGGIFSLIAGFDEKGIKITESFSSCTFKGYYSYKSKERIEKILVSKKLKNVWQFSCFTL